MLSSAPDPPAYNYMYVCAYVHMCVGMCAYIYIHISNADCCPRPTCIYVHGCMRICMCVGECVSV